MFLCGAGWAAGGLVVPGGVEDEFSEQFAGGGVQDADVQVLGQERDVGSGVGAADADVVEAAAGAEREVAGFADFVVADAVVGVGAAVAGDGFGPGGAGGGGGDLPGQGPVRPVVVIGAGEGVQEGLELADGRGRGALGAGPGSPGSPLLGWGSSGPAAQ